MIWGKVKQQTANTFPPKQDRWVGVVGVIDDDGGRKFIVCMPVVARYHLRRCRSLKIRACPIVNLSMIKVETAAAACTCVHASIHGCIYGCRRSVALGCETSKFLDM